jgi:hypothetical protein
MDLADAKKTEDHEHATRRIWSEINRIGDLVVAGEGPRTSDEWSAILNALNDVSDLVLEQREACIRAVATPTPQPRMVAGLGECSVHCAHYSPLDGISRMHSHVGYCHLATRGTRSAVPCHPWVEQREREALAREQQVHALTIRVDELQAERNIGVTGNVSPCVCGQPGVTGCSAHDGWLNGQWIGATPRATDPTTAMLEREAERRAETQRADASKAESLQLFDALQATPGDEPAAVLPLLTLSERCKCGRAYTRNSAWLSCTPCSKSFYSPEVNR